MLKRLQARLQQCMIRGHPDVQAGFRKWRRTRGQIAKILWIIEKAREFQKNISFLDYTKALTAWIKANSGKFLEMGVPDNLTCLLRNQYGGQEAAFRLDMEQWTDSNLGKEYIKDVYCHPAYLTYMQCTYWANFFTLLFHFHQEAI